MMKKLISLFALFLFGWAQVAQAGPWTVGPQTPVYSATTTHTLGDGSNPRGGIPPAFGYMPADIASNFTENDWIIGTCATGGGCGEFAAPGSGDEAKARFDCEYGFTAKDDPIVNPGAHGGASHQHHFLGNRLDLLGVNASDATYASLRGGGYSGCFGGPTNRTLYWEPAVMKTLTNGVTVELKVHTLVTYYIGGVMADHALDTSDPDTGTIWARGWKTISGFNMADPTQYTSTGTYTVTNPTTNRVNAAITAANAASHSGKYVASTVPAGFLGWYCETPASGNGSIATSPIAGADHQPWLRNTDGTPTLNCTAGTEIVADLITMPCWDGKNLDSPDGRGHMMPYLHDTDTGKDVCPEGWYRVLVFEAKAEFYQKGQADYTNWYLASDRMPGMTQFRNGESMHFDLIPAWSYGTVASPGVFIRFINHCAGFTIKLQASDTAMTGDRHECGSGRITNTENLYTTSAPPAGNPGSPNPIVAVPDFSGINRYVKPAVGTPVPSTIHNTH
jgi:hypothetical protein